MLNNNTADGLIFWLRLTWGIIYAFYLPTLYPSNQDPPTWPKAKFDLF